MSNIIEVPLRKFFGSAADIIIPVDNDKVFLPDPSWGKTFANALEKPEVAEKLKDKTVLEVGVGSGINFVGVQTGPNPAQKWIGVDFSPAAVAASQWIAQREGIEGKFFYSDLLSDVPDRILNRVNVIGACIPQVVKPKGAIVKERDLSDYYEERGVDEDKYGLGLIASLLDQTAKRAPHVPLILNIANRPGGERIQAMFNRHGYETSVLHKAVVQQDPTTCLASLAEIEKRTGLDFHFYGDPQAQERIQAGEAEKRRANGTPIYHNLYVLEAKLG